MTANVLWLLLGGASCTYTHLLLTKIHLGAHDVVLKDQRGSEVHEDHTQD